MKMTYQDVSVHCPAVSSSHAEDPIQIPEWCTVSSVAERWAFSPSAAVGSLWLNTDVVWPQLKISPRA